jgi:hypothetical protein
MLLPDSHQKEKRYQKTGVIICGAYEAINTKVT